MSWIQAHLTVARDAAAAAEAGFERLGALSITLADADDDPMLEPPPGATPLWRRTRVTGLFPADRDPQALARHIRETLPAGELAIERLEDRPWARAWLDHFRPMRFGHRLWIQPGNAERPTAKDAVVVELDPGLAFGTGTHPTTALCLEWLDGADLQGRRVIDYGCGSGILGIAALRLGAAEVTAVDHDPQALRATRDNAARNGVSERLRTHLPEDATPPAAELVVANILANVLESLAPRLSGLVATGGDLVLSGILEDQAPAVQAAYAAFDFHPPRMREGWALLHGTRR